MRYSNVFMRFSFFLMISSERNNYYHLDTYKIYIYIQSLKMQFREVVHCFIALKSAKNNLF